MAVPGLRLQLGRAGVTGWVRPAAACAQGSEPTRLAVDSSIAAIPARTSFSRAAVAGEFGHVGMREWQCIRHQPCHPLCHPNRVRDGVFVSLKSLVLA